MLETFHIRIKKDYAADVIKDLVKMDALEMIEDNEVPDWHIQIVNERVEEYKKNPKLALDFDDAMDDLKKNLIARIKKVVGLGKSETMEKDSDNIKSLESKNNN